MFEYNAMIVRVIDGDTVEADIDLGFYVTTRVKLRLDGIDTPEIFRPSNSEERNHGYDAKAHVERLVLNKPCIVKTSKTGKYGRWIAGIVVNGIDVVESLLENNFAKREYY